MFLRFSVISFRARRLWHSANAAPKSIKNDAQIRENSSQIHPKLVKMVPQSVPKVILEASRRSVIRPGVFGDHLWRHLGDFGRHFGPSWAPRGSQNRAFGRQGVPKAAKIASKKRSKKKLDFLIEF